MVKLVRNVLEEEKNVTKTKIRKSDIIMELKSYKKTLEQKVLKIILGQKCIQLL